MAKPSLDGPDRYAGLMPAGSTRLAETMQVDMLAHRVRLARDLDLVF
jgi:hypothetical protein